MVKKIIVLSLFFISCARPLQKNTFVVASTYLEVTSPDARAATVVYEEMRRLSNIFDAYNPDSELSRLNKTYLVPFRASEDLIAVLKLSREIYDLTSGAFDASQGVLYNFWKGLIAKKKIQALPSEEFISQIRNKQGMEAIEINSENKTVMIKEKGLAIDLGAIAKGYMVDKAVAKLKEKGINSALINLGGHIYCLGKNQDKPWKVGIRDPEKAGTSLKMEELTDQTIATSGNYEQFFDYAGRRYSHLVDPRTGFPVSAGIDSITVVIGRGEKFFAPTALADGLATAFFILGKDEADKILVKMPQEARIIVVDSNE